MGQAPKRYTPEFRRQMVELHRTGRSLRELAKESGCTTWSIRTWVKQAGRDEGRGDGGLTSVERGELTRLERVRVGLPFALGALDVDNGN